jgi:putative transposase
MLARRRELAEWIQLTFQVSSLRTCRSAQFSRAAWYRRRRARDQSALRPRIHDLVCAQPRCEDLRTECCLWRDGWLVNRKRVRELYRLET